MLHHELALLLLGALLVALTWHAPNHGALVTFTILWVMRQSAKLNVFLGVRNLNESFLPVHLEYLQSYFRRRAMNLLFPFSVIAGTAVAASMCQFMINEPRASGIGATPSDTMVWIWCHRPRRTSGWLLSQLKWPCRDSATIASTMNGTSAGEARWMRGTTAADAGAATGWNEESSTMHLSKGGASL